MKRVAVILSGCGVYDGSEIHESVLTLLALDRAGAEVVWAAPDIPQAHVVDHQRGIPMEGEVRNVRTESARIARGPVHSIEELDPASLDAVILPGGYGAAKNLSDFAFRGSEVEVEASVADFLNRFRATGKPIGLICIAPAIGARLFGGEGLRYTVGDDPESIAALAPLGGTALTCPVQEMVVDEALNIISTPAYQDAKRITEAEAGINKLVAEVLRRA